MLGGKKLSEAMSEIFPFKVHPLKQTSGYLGTEKKIKAALIDIC